MKSHLDSGLLASVLEQITGALAGYDGDAGKVEEGESGGDVEEASCHREERAGILVELEERMTMSRAPTT